MSAAATCWSLEIPLTNTEKVTEGETVVGRSRYADDLTEPWLVMNPMSRSDIKNGARHPEVVADGGLCHHF